LDQETQDYTDYRLDVRHYLRQVRAWCLPFPTKSAKVEELIDWVAGEVKNVSDTVWQLNDNFAISAIEGVLNMLNDEGCQELGHLHGLAASCDASIV
jgi:hypothetical protein